MGKLSASVWMAAATMLFAGTAVAGNTHIYKWVDGQGVVHYSDMAPAEAQPAMTRLTLPDFPPPDPQAEAADQAWIASINQWYQNVLDQQAQLQYQEYLAWEQSQPVPAPVPTSAPDTQEFAYVVPVCWPCERFHFHHHHRRPLLSAPTPQSIQNSVWHPQTGPLRLHPFKP
ncbi:MAG: DUF4124 domain-containing protein [Gammaproteobacteria bacterium]|nr:DUF4124 domain-containing protein [Gammaproteobacteria bacterium]